MGSTNCIISVMIASNHSRNGTEIKTLKGNNISVTSIRKDTKTGMQRLCGARIATIRNVGDEQVMLFAE